MAEQLDELDAGKVFSVGVGLLLGFRDEKVYVRKVLEDGSAAANGRIHKNDVIVAVDGTPTLGMDLEKVKDLVKGEAGSSLVIEVSRKIQGSPVTVKVNLTRQPMLLRETERSFLGPVFYRRVSSRPRLLFARPKKRFLLFRAATLMLMKGDHEQATVEETFELCRCHLIHPFSDSAMNNVLAIERYEGPVGSQRLKKHAFGFTTVEAMQEWRVRIAPCCVQVQTPKVSRAGSFGSNTAVRRHSSRNLIQSPTGAQPTLSFDFTPPLTGSVRSPMHCVPPSPPCTVGLSWGGAPANDWSGCLQMRSANIGMPL